MGAAKDSFKFKLNPHIKINIIYKVVPLIHSLSTKKNYYTIFVYNCNNINAIQLFLLTKIGHVMLKKKNATVLIEAPIHLCHFYRFYYKSYLCNGCTCATTDYIHTVSN